MGIYRQIYRKDSVQNTDLEEWKSQMEDKANTEEKNWKAGE